MKKRVHRTRRRLNFILLLLGLAGLAVIVAGQGSAPQWLQRFSSPSEQAGEGPRHVPNGALNTGETMPTSPLASSTPEASPSPSPTPAPQYAEADWIAVGDLMMHSPQVPGAYDAKKKRYVFDSFFSEVKSILSSGDWVLANLETPIAGNDRGFKGYPLFNAPIELADAMKQAGFTIVTTANNHALDQGVSGALNTLKTLKQHQFTVTGTAASAADAAELVLVEKNGIVMGMLAYTYGTNGIPIPKDKPYIVNLIDENKIIQDIRKLRGAGADFVTVALHFGKEYETAPNEEQKRLARKLAAAGADIIAGSHPHVIQPYEVVDMVDEQGRSRQALIIYSMGNFISNQRGLTKEYGVIYKVKVRKQLHDGTIQLTAIEPIPTYTHRYKPDAYYRYRVLPLPDILKASEPDPLLSKSEYPALEAMLSKLTTRIQSMSSGATAPASAP
ncbi:CapA family protein [Paenibacillus sp. GCM10023252]|uniref:CapA family protein n=1 Tax=Paenibacillus sp. GCM10023252 TaxID=3252649 RepID=UPI003619DC3A